MVDPDDPALEVETGKTLNYSSNTPTDLENKPLIFDANPATIEGILQQIDYFFRRMNLFQDLILYGAKTLDNSKTCTLNIASARLLEHNLTEFDCAEELFSPEKRARPVTERMAATNLLRVAKGLVELSATAPLLPSSQYMVAPLSVSKHDLRLRV